LVLLSVVDGLLARLVQHVELEPFGGNVRISVLVGSYLVPGMVDCFDTIACPCGHEIQEDVDVFV
jgi:hypothetical protein